MNVSYVYLVKLKHPEVAGCVPMSVHRTSDGARKRAKALTAEGMDPSARYVVEMYYLMD